jgi:hypothetical protein
MRPYWQVRLAGLVVASLLTFGVIEIWAASVGAVRTIIDIETRMVAAAEAPARTPAATPGPGLVPVTPLSAAPGQRR